MPPTDITELDDLARVMRALSDPVRLRILGLVAAEGELTCSPLAEALGIPQSTLSRHLATLRDAGLTYSRRDGLHRWVGLRADDVDAQYPGLLTAILTKSAPLSSKAFGEARSGSAN